MNFLNFLKKTEVDLSVKTRHYQHCICNTKILMAPYKRFGLKGFVLFAKAKNPFLFKYSSSIKMSLHFREDVS